MMTRSQWLALAVMTALTASNRSAEAEPAPAAASQPTKKQLDQARAHFEAAEVAKARREYQTAAVEYLAAYELFQDPEFFYNVAEVYRLAGDESNALVYYEKYLELDRSGRGVEAARNHAAQIRRSIAAQQDAIARATAEQDARRKADEARRKTEEETPRASARPPRTPGRSVRMAGIATGGAGVVALGVGMVFGLQARSIEDEVNDAPVYDPSRYADGEAAERKMFVFTGVGIAALVTGGVLYYVGHRTARAAERAAGVAVTFTPTVGPSQIALTAVGRF